MLLTFALGTLQSRKCILRLGIFKAAPLDAKAMAGVAAAAGAPHARSDCRHHARHQREQHDELQRIHDKNTSEMHVARRRHSMRSAGHPPICRFFLLMCTSHCAAPALPGSPWAMPRPADRRLLLQRRKISARALLKTSNQHTRRHEAHHGARPSQQRPRRPDQHAHQGAEQLPWARAQDGARH